MAYYKATIEILVNVADETHACDCISEALRPLLREFAGPDSSVIDWRYAGAEGYPDEHNGDGFEYATATA